LIILKKIIFTISFLVFTSNDERRRIPPEIFDSKGWLIFSIIILLQYNIVQRNIITQKRLSLANLGLKNGLLRDWKVWFSGKTSQQYKK